MGLKKPHLRYKNQTRRERTWTIHLISLEKTIKGTVLIVVAFELLSFFGSDVHAWALDFVTRHGIDLTNRYVQMALARLVGVGNTQLVEMSGVALVYSGLLFTEGIGLWLQKRWAEYLTTFATALFIPFEIYELYERLTWVRVAIIVLNIFIVWYLATRLKDEKTEVAGTDGSGSDTPLVKICGITGLDDALLAVEYGADALGFNFYDRSPRYISPENARAISDRLPEHVLKVGVFVNETVDKVCEIARVAGLDAVQLHGDEDRAFVNDVRNRSGLVVIKALRVSQDFRPQDTLDYEADAILLDSYSKSERGGTGDTFDWEVARQVRSLVPGLYLAGGLSPENVADAINRVHPYAVDACSQLESRPGKKDADKLKRFIAAVKGTL